MSEDTSELVAGATAALGDAIHALIGLRPGSIERDDFETEPIVLDSLYTELCEARHGERLGDATRRPTPGSRPPGWTDALSLIIRIDQRVALWWPHTPDDHHNQPVTVRRLYALLDYRWRPQDVADVTAKTREIKGWVTQAKVLLPTEEVHTWELRAPCPSCGATTTQVDDGTGELVRRYALQADKNSAKCTACETNWDPGQYRFLAKLLGSELPEGVLE